MDNQANTDKKLSKDKKEIKGEKTKLINSKYRCYSSTKPKHPYLTEAARKDLDKIFWID